MKLLTDTGRLVFNLVTVFALSVAVTVAGCAFWFGFDALAGLFR